MLQNLAVQTNPLTPFIEEERDHTSYLAFYLGSSLFALPSGAISNLFMSPIVMENESRQFLYQGDFVTSCDIKYHLGIAGQYSIIGQSAVICEHRQQLYAINIDKVDAVYRISDDAVYYPPIECSALISGVFRMKGEAVFIIDYRTLFECLDGTTPAFVPCKYNMSLDFWSPE